MPNPRVYSSSADRQAAYRVRVAQTKMQQRDDATAPTVNPDNGNPPRAKWNSLKSSAMALLETLQNDMQAYHDARSEKWQEGERAAQILETIDGLQNLVSEMEGMEI